MNTRAFGVLGALFVFGCTCSSQVIDRTREMPSPGAGGAATLTDGSASGGTAAEHASTDAGTEALGPHSGSRLKVEAWTVDGVSTPTGVVTDSRTGKPCSPTKAEDGATRCLPQGSSIFYTDDACKTPIGALRQNLSACEGPTGKFEYAVAGPIPLRCPETTAAVYKVGAAVPPPAHVYESGPLGCVESGSPDGTQFFDVTPSPSEDWVKLEPEVTKVTTRLGVRHLVGSDGSRLFGGVVLLPDQLRCTPMTFTGESNRCLPDMAPLGTGYFRDEKCTEPVALTGSCDKVGIVWGSTDAGAFAPVNAASIAPCAVRGTSPFAPLFRAVPNPETYTPINAQSGCDPVGGFQYYAPGERVSFDSFPEVREVHEGSGRIQPVYLESEGQRLAYVDGQLFDTTYESTCVPSSAGYCIPSVANVGAFADPKCSVPLVSSDGACSPPSVASLDAFTSPCTTTSVWYAVGALHHGAVYGGALDSCGPSQYNFPLYEVGARLDPDVAFAKAVPSAL